MDLNQDIRPFPLPPRTEIISVALRGRYIWILSKDNSLIIYNRSNLSVPQRFNYTSPNNMKPQMIVDDNGTKCLMFWKACSILYFNLTTTEFISIPTPPGSIPQCGTWVVGEHGDDIVLLCTCRGEVILVNPESSCKCNFITPIQNGNPIQEIIAYKGFLNLVFLLSHDQVQCFSGSEPFECLFRKETSSNIVLGKMNRQMQRRFSIEPVGQMCKVGVVFEYGLLFINATLNSKNKPFFNQENLLIETSNLISYTRCKYGIFLVHPTDVQFLTSSSFSIDLDIPGIQNIEMDDSIILLYTKDQINYIRLEDLKKVLCKKALEMNDPQYALLNAIDIDSKKQALRMLLKEKKATEAGKIIYQLNWSFEEVAEVIPQTSVLMLFYLQEVVKEKIVPIQKFTIMQWIFYLYTMHIQKYQNDFIEWIKINYDSLPKEYTYQRLKQIGFQEGIVVYAECIKDTNQLIEKYILEGEPEKIIKILPHITNSSQFNSIILRILPTCSEVITQYLLKSYPASSETILPILCQLPECAKQYLMTSYQISWATTSLLVMALAQYQDETELISLLLGGCVVPNFILRACTYFGCKRAASRVLLEIGKPERAISVAYEVGYDWAFSLIQSSPIKEMQKRAWLKLLQIVDVSDREKALQALDETDLFSFEEMMDFIGDDIPLMKFEKQIMDFVDQTEKKAVNQTYKNRFGIKPPMEFKLQLCDNCEICQNPIIGTKFIRFPCNHMVHSECMKQFMSTKSFEVGIKPGMIDSCPLCGFLAVGNVEESFDNSTLNS